MTSLAGELEVVVLLRMAKHDPVKARMIGKGSQLHELHPVPIESDNFVEAIRWPRDAQVCSLNHSFNILLPLLLASVAAQHTVPSLFRTRLLDCDLQPVRRHAIHRQVHIYIAAPRQAAWQRNIELIQSHERSLRSRIKGLGVDSPDLHVDRTERASITQARPEPIQEAVAGPRIQINRRGDELTPLFVKARHRLEAL